MMLAESGAKTAFDDLAMPPCAATLGWRLIDARPADGWVRIGFEGRPEFVNPAGFIQGGFLAAMLDDTMGPAVFVHTEGRVFTPTIDMHLTFLNPARPGPLFAEAQVVQLGKSIVFMEGRLMDAAGTMLVKATASARVVAAEKLPG